MAPQLNKFKSFLDTVLSKVPEADRESVRSLYSQAHDEASALERELTTSIAAVNQRAQEQAAWWERHKHLATGQPTPNSNGGGQPNPNGGGQPNPAPQPNPQPAFDPNALLTEVDRRIGQSADLLAGQGLALSTILPTLVAQHGVEFGEVLDAEKLAKDAIAANTDIRSFYNQSVAERRATKAKEKYEADIRAAEERGRVAGLTEATRSHLPYPTTRQEATTLSGLRVPEADKQKAAQQFSLDAAVATAMEVMNKQSQAGA
jgi:hypothetical protein